MLGSIKLKQTVSIGVATWDGRESAEALQARADEAMYYAKQTGRDRVEFSPARKARSKPRLKAGKATGAKPKRRAR